MIELFISKKGDRLIFTVIAGGLENCNCCIDIGVDVLIHIHTSAGVQATLLCDLSFS